MQWFELNILIYFVLCRKHILKNKILISECDWLFLFSDRTFRTGSFEGGLDGVGLNEQGRDNASAGKHTYG